MRTREESTCASHLEVAVLDGVVQQARETPIFMIHAALRESFLVREKI